MSKVMIIAELSANHNGNKQIAIDTIVAAKKSGADAVKLQTYIRGEKRCVSKFGRSENI